LDVELSYGGRIGTLPVAVADVPGDIAGEDEIVTADATVVDVDVELAAGDSTGAKKRLREGALAD
jgi:hypothetical protein